MQSPEMSRHLRRILPQTNTAFGAYSISHRGFTLTPAHNFAKKATVVTLSKKLSSGQTVKGSYSLKDQAAVLELGVAPLTVLSLFFLACMYSSPIFLRTCFDWT